MTRESSSMPTLMATSPLHLKPNASVAERALLHGDPGRALRLAQHLLAAPMQVLNTNRGLWGYTGTAADGGR
jgi:purine-nucleoside phosphorylase